VGYVSYDVIRFYEPSVNLNPNTDLPDAIFLQADTVAAFDHAFGRLILIAVTDGEAGLDETEARLNGFANVWPVHCPFSQTFENPPQPQNFAQTSLARITWI
jgi:anthranilate/para-aminobenzoate synthase component I